jgi:hypothetical protein
MSFTEDLSEFIDTDDFADTATISGLSTTVDGIYDRELVDLDSGVAGWRSVLIVATSDVTDVVIGATVDIDGLSTTYTVTQKRKDDDEVLTTLILET